MSITIRCSSIPTALQCAPSAINPYGWDRISPQSDDANVGSAIHKALAQWHTQLPDLDAIAQEFHCDRNLLGIGYNRGLQILEMFPTIEHPHVEERVEHQTSYTGGVNLTGHPDLWFEYQDVNGHPNLVVLDWKLKSIEGKMAQLRGYAACITMGMAVYRLEHLRPDEEHIQIQLILVSLLDDEYEKVVCTYDDLLDFYSTLENKLTSESNPAFEPSWKGCRYCDLKHDCTAYHKFASHNIDLFFGVHPAEMSHHWIEVLLNGFLPEIWERRSGVYAIYNAMNEELKHYLSEQPDHSVISGGKRFSLVEQNAGEFIDARNPYIREKGMMLTGFWDSVGEVGLKRIKEAMVSAEKGNAKRAPNGALKRAEGAIAGMFAEEEIIKKTKHIIQVKEKKDE